MVANAPPVDRGLNLAPGQPPRHSPPGMILASSGLNITIALTDTSPGRSLVLWPWPIQVPILLAVSRPLTVSAP